MDIIIEHEVCHKNGFIACAQDSIGVFSLARRIANYQASILITGETGTGKECIAKYIHANASGRDAPYVGVNCAAIPESMLEAILFGYEKGAFTGAVSSLAGKFEQANGGTLLLDEIGDMPLGLQAKLLRVLQEKEVERLGSHKRIPLNIRLVSSTNKDLLAEVDAGRFRQDLFYRIAVLPIHITPLRQRQQDILPLAHRFIAKYHALHQTKATLSKIHLSECARQALLNYDWPGNVRELENVIQRGLILRQGDQIYARDFGLITANQPPAIAQLVENQLPPPTPGNVKLQGRMAEYHYIIELLKNHNGSKTKTAESLGITPRALRYRLASMRRLNLGPNDNL